MRVQNPALLVLLMMALLQPTHEAVAALSVPVSSTFDSDLDGWTLTGDSSILAWDAPGGDPDGYVYYSDNAGGAGFIKAPPKFLGDWSNLDWVGSLSFHRRILDVGCAPNTIGGTDVVISGPAGSAHHLLPPMAVAGPWETVSIPIDSRYWQTEPGVVWGDLLGNVNDLRIQIEMVGNECGPPGDKDGIDTITLQMGRQSFADGIFVPGEWETFTFFGGNGGAASAFGVPAGGNPNEFEEINLSVSQPPPYSAVYVFRGKTSALYTPSAQGAILSIDYTEDAIILDGTLPGFVQATGPALKQDGNVYAYRNPVLGTGTELSWHTLSLIGVTESGFCFLGPVQSPGDITDSDCARHPDWSSTGSVIEFGFYRGNSAGIGSYQTRSGLDNWSIVLDATPTLDVERSGSQTTVTWSAVAGDATYDLLRGDLTTLRSTGGDFTAALNAISPPSSVCMANDAPALASLDQSPDPAAGGGYFYLVRVEDGSYDDGPSSLAADRNPGINASGAACP